MIGTEQPNKAKEGFLCFALNKEGKMQARYIIMTVAANDKFLCFLTIISKALRNKPHISNGKYMPYFSSWMPLINLND